MHLSGIRVYGYRWVVLLAYMAIIAVSQLLWITFASVTTEAMGFYKVSDLSIGLLTLSFMVVFLIMALPASWIIASHGIRLGIGIGAGLTGIFGLMRGLVAANYTWVLIAQIAIAAGQPFVLNALTTVAARWFPAGERATATGLGFLAMYIGILVGLALTPYLVVQVGIPGMLMAYGVAAAIAMFLFLVFAHERPATPPHPAGEEWRSLVQDGLSHMFRRPGFVLLLPIFFIGLGAFYAVTTWIEQILAPRGFSITQAGNVGGIMILGGIVGAAILPLLSDRLRKRVPFVIAALAGAGAGLAGLTFLGTYTGVLLSSFLFGFFLLGAGPIGFQLGAETALPAPEGSSNGLLLLMGQVAGIVFILGMQSLKAPQSGSMRLSMLILLALFVIALVLASRLREPPALSAA